MLEGDLLRKLLEGGVTEAARGGLLRKLLEEGVTEAARRGLEEGGGRRC